mmetsp:Transcript_1834/g.3467  ORF Transcript_1834/g.3467 Transcript_1834/m.3467 type:complete len:98 (-) Transcript_1834:69-362(-)
MQLLTSGDLILMALFYGGTARCCGKGYAQGCSSSCLVMLLASHSPITPKSVGMLLSVSCLCRYLSMLYFKRARLNKVSANIRRFLGHHPVLVYDMNR